MSRRWISRTAVEWALFEAEGLPARLVSTLVAVAVYAGDDGRGAYPSASTVAAITRKSETQAKRDIAELEKLGLLQPGDRRTVMQIRSDRRPNVYDLAMERGASRRTPQGVPRGASGDRTGCIPLQNGVRPDAPEEFLKNSGTAGDVPRADGAVHTPAPTPTPAALSAPYVAPLDMPWEHWPPAPCCGHQFTVREASRYSRDAENATAGREGRLLCGGASCGKGRITPGAAL